MLKTVGSLFAMMCLVACGGDADDPQAGETGADAATLPSCDALCPAVLAAKCTHGPVDQTDCVSGCMSVRASACASEYNALYECGGAKPIYSCDATGQVSLKNCDSKAALLYACVAKQ